MFDPDILLTLGAAVLAFVVVLLAYMPPSVCVFSITTPPRGRFAYLCFAKWVTSVFILLNTVLGLAAPHRFPLISDLIAIGVLVLLLAATRKPTAAIAADKAHAGPA
jgi:hypothetical protein